MIRLRQLLLLLTLCLPMAITQTSCGGKKDTASASGTDAEKGDDEVDESSDLLPLPAIQPGEAFSKDFEGKLSKDLTVRMHLDYFGNGSVTGWYYYRNIGLPILLSGTLDDKMNFELTEYVPGVGETGKFKGRVKSKNFLEGSWNGSNGKSFNLALEEIDFGHIIEVRKLERKPKKGEILNININVRYPYFIARNPKDQDKYSKINSAIEKDAVAGFNASKSEFESENAGYSSADDVLMSNERTDDVSFNIYFQSEDLISIYYFGYMFAGGAHGLPVEYSYNYDLKTNKELKLPDIINIKGKGLEKLAQYCVPQLKKILEGEIPFPEGAEPNENNYSNIVLTPAALLVHFSAYQVAPYAAGSQDVVVPFDKIGGAIQGSVLSKLKIGK